MVATTCLLSIVSVVAIAAFVTTIIAVAIPVWSSETTEGTVQRDVVKHTYTGIWTSCTWEEVKTSQYTCDRLEGETDAMKATQAMTLMGGMLCAGVVILVFLKCCLFKDNKIIGIAIVVMCIASGVFLAVGAIVFAGKVSVDADDLHAGFGLTIIAAALIMAAGIIMICIIICA